MNEMLICHLRFCPSTELKIGANKKIKEKFCFFKKTESTLKKKVEELGFGWLTFLTVYHKIKFDNFIGGECVRIKKLMDIII